MLIKDLTFEKAITFTLSEPIYDKEEAFRYANLLEQKLKDAGIKVEKVIVAFTHKTYYAKEFDKYDSYMHEYSADVIIHTFNDPSEVQHVLENKVYALEKLKNYFEITKIKRLSSFKITTTAYDH